MKAFDLKKYLKEGRLYEEEMSSFPPFRDERPSETIMLAVDKAYYDDNEGEFTLTPTDVIVTADNWEDIIFDEVGDEEVDFTSYVRTYPKIFKRRKEERKKRMRGELDENNK
jgi:hypothetical protein